MDESRILNSRGARRHPRGVNFVKHNPQQGIEGTDLVPDMVEEYDPLKDLDTTQDTFNPANPTYLATTPTAGTPQPVEDDEDVDPHDLFWTNNPYDDGTDVEENSQA